MTLIRKTILTYSTIALLTGASVPSYAGDVLGTLLGATGGAIAGSNIGKGKGNIAAIAVGTLLGAGLGSTLDTVPTGYAQPAEYNEYYDGYGYDRSYRRHHPHHNNYGYIPSNTDYWTGPRSTTQVTQVSTTMYQPAPNPNYCREFTQTVSIGGRIQESYGTACRQPDGTWEIQK